MNEVELGHSGVQVSEICLGTMYFGIKVPEDESFRLMDYYYDRGGRFFDTANKYATWVPGFPEPVGEGLLHRWMKSRNNRNHITIATKMGFPYGDVPRGLSKDLILQEVDKSLKRLGVEQIDLLYAHADDSQTPVEETMEAFHSVIQSGKVKLIGSSNFSSWRMALANHLAKEHEWTPYCCTQARLSVLWPKVNANFGRQLPGTPELIEYCQENHVSILCYSPLLQGIFGREDRSVPPEYDTPQNQEIYKMIKEEASEKGVSGNTIVLSWMRSQNFIPLITGSNLKQIKENLDSLDYPITPELDDRIRKIYYPHKE